MNDSPRKNSPWVSIAVFIFSACYLSFFCLYNFKIADEGIPLNGAMRILRGETPWQDFHGYVPGRYWLHALIFKLWGEDLVPIRFTIALLTAGAAALIFSTSRYLMPLPFALMGTVLLIAAPGVYYGRYLLFFTALILIPIMRYCQGSTRAAFWTGLVGAVTCLFRQDAGFIFICVSIFLFWFKEGFLDRDFPRAVRNIFRCILGWAVIWLPILGIIAFHGTFSEWFVIQMRFFAGGYQTLILPFPKLSTHSLHEWLLFYAPVTIFAAFGFILLRKSLTRKMTPQEIFLLFVFLVGLGLFNQALWRTQPENTLKVMAPVLILYSFGSYLLWDRFKASVFKIAVAGVILILPINYVWKLNTQYKFFLGSAGPDKHGYRLMQLERGQVFAPERVARVFEKLVEYTLETTQPDDAIYISPFMGLPVYFLADRRNPTYYEWILPPGLITFPNIQEEIIRSLEEDQTGLIIYYDFAVDGLEKRRFKRYAPKLTDYFFDHYYLDRTIENYWMLRRGKTNIAALQQQTNSGTPRVYGSVQWGQSFMCKGNGLQEIKVRLQNPPQGFQAKLIFHLTEASKPMSDIFSATVKIHDPILNEWQSFSFPPIVDSNGKEFYFYLESPESEEHTSIALGTFGSDHYYGGQLKKNHQPVEGDLSFVALTNRSL